MVTPKLSNQDYAEVLAGIDYANLKGEHFKKYNDLVNGALSDQSKKLETAKNPRINALPGTLMFDFEGYRVAAIIEELHEGVKDSPMIITGVTINNPKPEVTTRISVQAARDLNAQLANHNSRVPGMYYLIKKVPVVVAEPPAIDDMAASQGVGNVSSDKKK